MTELIPFLQWSGLDDPLCQVYSPFSFFALELMITLGARSTRPPQGPRRGWPIYWPWVSSTTSPGDFYNDQGELEGGRNRFWHWNDLEQFTPSIHANTGKDCWGVNTSDNHFPPFMRWSKFLPPSNSDDDRQDGVLHLNGVPGQQEAGGGGRLGLPDWALNPPDSIQWTSKTSLIFSKWNQRWWFAVVWQYGQTAWASWKLFYPRQWKLGPK